MRWAIILTFVLASCSEPESDKLQRQFDLLERNKASNEELCAKSREILDALVREESEDYTRRKVMIASPCIEVQLDQLKLVR